VTAELQMVERARSDRQLVVLEGFHAVKHAVRFGAELTLLVTDDVEAAVRLALDLAPDLIETFETRAVAVSRDGLRAAAPHVRTGVVGVAGRPRVDLGKVLAPGGGAPVVLLEDPRDLGNVGAVVRVAAAADIAGVVTTGRSDPWDPAALRGSAGLHFALPVARLDALGSGRPVIGFDPEGELFTPGALPVDAVLAFGTERAGLSDELLARCDARLAVPMRAGVSSLNLATSVSAVVFAWRLAQEWRGDGAASRRHREIRGYS
jgi:TrmH family RNA methyltransferase